jgi:hypothetical protein
MKQSRFSLLLPCAAIIFFLVSCGSNEQKESSESTTADSTTAATETTLPVNTIITTPQNIMVASHKVKDFAKWKASYDEHDSLRLANGVHSFVIGRGAQDSNMVLVVVKVDDLNKAKSFAKDPSLKKAMQQSGVVGAPTIKFTTMTFQDTGMISTDLRSRATFTVKDWDTWQRTFDSTRQVILDNGLSIRAYGHDADDNHKVTLITAITDTAKANAFWKSDLLKQRRALGGVVGEPQRFIYHMVQRY